MKKLLCALILLPILSISQNPGFTLLKKINGVEINYKVSKTKIGEKKDTWLIEYEYYNSTGTDIFYKTYKGKKDTGILNSILDATSKENKEVQISNFAIVFIENTKALDFTSDTKRELTGDKTRISTDVGENIYRLKKGKTYTTTMDFKANKGVEPVISIQVVNSISFTDNIFEFL